MENLKITFIKKIREQVDVSMKTAIEYYEKYNSNLDTSLETLKNDFATKLQQELEINFKEAKETLEMYKYNYESAYFFLKAKSMSVIDKILMNEKLSNEEKTMKMYRILGDNRKFSKTYPPKNFKEVLIFFCHEFGYEISITESKYQILLDATNFLENKSISNILNNLQDEKGKFIPEKYQKYLPELQIAILKIIEENKTLFYE
jgi:hypothetical protein